MRAPRFSLAWLMGIVFFCAVGAGALHGANELWAGAVFSLAVLAMLVALVVGLVRRGKARAGGLGFAVFGIGYLMVTLGPWGPANVGAPAPLTTLLLQQAYPRLHPSPNVPTSQAWVVSRPQGAAWTGNPPSNGSSTIAYFSSVTSTVVAPPPSNVNPSDFFRVGHSLLALLAACLGAILGRVLFERNEPRPQDQNSSSPQPFTEN